MELDTFHTATDGIGISPFRDIEFYKVAFGFNQNFVFEINLETVFPTDSGGGAYEDDFRHNEPIRYMTLKVTINNKVHAHKIRISENQYNFAVKLKSINTLNPLVLLRNMKQKRKINPNTIKLKVKLRNAKDK